MAKIKKRIAIYKWVPYGYDYVKDAEAVETCPDTEYVRKTNIVEVEFEELDEAEVIEKEVKVIEKEIEQIKERSLQSIRVLQDRKAELQGLTFVPKEG